MRHLQAAAPGSWRSAGMAMIVMHRELLLAGKYGRPELDTVTLEDNNREE